MHRRPESPGTLLPGGWAPAMVPAPGTATGTATGRAARSIPHPSHRRRRRLSAECPYSVRPGAGRARTHRPDAATSCGVRPGTARPPVKRRLSIPFLQDLLQLAIRKEASAVYVVPWMPPTLRIDERMAPASQVSFTPQQTSALVRDLLDEAQRATLDKSREIEFSCVVEGIGRFRVHAFRRHGQPAMALRPYSEQVPTLAELGLPAVLQKVALADRGLVLVGSRSLSLRADAVAAIIDHRNRHGRGEILLLEDATRAWHEARACSVRQGVGWGRAEQAAHHRALHPAEPPVAVAWGEARDQPSLLRAVRAARGALCLVTLPADGVLELLQLAAELADSQDSDSGHNKLAMALHAALALRRVPALAGGELAACEVLLNAPEVAVNLVERDMPGLRATLQAMRGAGASSFDDHLAELVAAGRVAPDEASRLGREAAVRPTTGPAGSLDVGPPATGAADPTATILSTADPVPAAAPGGPSALDVDLSEPLAEALAEPVRPQADTRPVGFEWSGRHVPDEAWFGTPTLAPSSFTFPPKLQPEPQPEVDGLSFRVFAQRSLASGRSGVLDLWVGRRSQADDITRLAADSSQAPTADTGAARRGHLVKVQLAIDGLTVYSPRQQMAWLGEPSHMGFLVAVPPATPAGPRAATVRLALDGIPVGELHFMVQVAEEAVPILEDVQAAHRLPRRGYASHAAEDHAEVGDRVDRVRELVPDLALLVDAPRPIDGEPEKERTLRQVYAHDRLLLFWSRHAAQSARVAFEWRAAFQRGGIDAIDAVPLESPTLAPPPPELARLPFSDAFVTLLKAGRREERAVAKG